MADEAKTVEARAKQSAASKSATLDLLKNKKHAQRTFTLFLHDEDGEQIEVTLTYQSIGAKAYDKLVSKYPPKPEQRVDGATYDIDKFGPALIAACCIEPEMTVADAEEIWNSSAWSRGDVIALFRTAVELNNSGVDIPFSGQG